MRPLYPELEDSLEVLSAISADLVSDSTFLPCLRRLFSYPQGKWQELIDIVDGEDKMLDTLEDLGPDFAPIYVTWLPFQKSENGNGYCLIIFYLESQLWSFTALFNCNIVVMSKRE
jgi:hypothetical protein